MSNEELIAQLNKKDKQLDSLNSILANVDFYGVLSHIIMPIQTANKEMLSDYKAMNRFFEYYIEEIGSMLSDLRRYNFAIDFRLTHKNIQHLRSNEQYGGDFLFGAVQHKGFMSDFAYKSVSFTDNMTLQTRVRTILKSVYSPIVLMVNDDRSNSNKVIALTEFMQKPDAYISVDTEVDNMGSVYAQNANVNDGYEKSKLLINVVQEHHKRIIELVNDGYDDMLEGFIDSLSKASYHM